MSDVTYHDLGIPELYGCESFHYAPTGNIGVSVFNRKEAPHVSRIFWRRPEDKKYSMIPVADENHSLDSCFPSISSETVYYTLMHWKKPEGHKSFGGHWVSLNSFCLKTKTEKVLVSPINLEEMTGTKYPWISKIVHISPMESEIDVIAGIQRPEIEGRSEMEYAVYRLDLNQRKIVHRFSMSGVFI